MTANEGARRVVWPIAVASRCEPSITGPGRRHQGDNLVVGPGTRRGNRDLKIGELLLKRCNHSQQNRQVPLDLTHAASGKDRQPLDPGGIRRLSIAAACSRFACLLPHLFDERVSDERGETRLEQRRLERKEAAQLVYRRLDLRYPSLLPRPDLGTDDIHRTDAARLRVRREPEVHSRVVDRADDIRPPVIDCALHRALDPQEVEEAKQYRKDADHCQILSSKPVVGITAEFRARAHPQDCDADALGVQETRFLAG